MRNILIPTDFSENAMNAVKYALELFKYERSNFYFLHVYQDEVYQDIELLNTETFETITEIVSKRSQDNLEALLKEVNEISPNPNHKYDIISANNLLIDEVDLITDGKNIDIVVMGTKGKTNDRKLTFGSHTLQVLKYVSCPVLSIPSDYKHREVKHVLFATNYMIPYKRRELKLLCEMVRSYKGIIDMLHISKSGKLSRRQEDNRLFIEEELNKNPVHFKTVDNKNITNAIFTYVKENAVDMLVMVNTRHSFLEELLFPSTVDKMSLNIDIPFLTMQNVRR